MLLRHMRLLLICLCTLNLWPAAQAQSVDPIQQMLDQGRADTAFELASQRLSQEEGNPEFDYLYGLAAVNSGHHNEAIFALERVLAQRPSHHRARLELARAYFASGNLPAADTHFELVEQQQPPKNVQTRIQQYRQKIAELLQQGPLSFHVTAGLTLGYDSNINTATSSSSVDIPALGVITLSNNSRSMSDSFREFYVTGDWDYVLSKRKSAFIKASVRNRDNFDSSAFDSTSFGLSGGYRFKVGDDLVRIPLQLQKMQLDGDDYRDLSVVGIDWQHALNEQQTLTWFGQVGALRHADSTVRDVNVAIAGALWRKQLGFKQAAFSAGAYLGRDTAIQEAGEHHGRTYLGIKAGFEWQPAPQHTAYVLAGLQQGEYAGVDPVFNVTRDDRFAQLVLGWNYKLKPEIELKSKLELLDNHSNVTLYDYDRQAFSVTLETRF